MGLFCDFGLSASLVSSTHTRIQDSQNLDIIMRRKKEVALIPVFIYLLDFDSLDLPTCFPMHALGAFDGAAKMVSGFEQKL